MRHLVRLAEGQHCKVGSSEFVVSSEVKIRVPGRDKLSGRECVQVVVVVVVVKEGGGKRQKAS
jgi:hypothetical protein